MVEMDEQRSGMAVTVVGSGYVGTVVAACFAHVGHRVVGLEIDPGRLSALRAGLLPFHEHGLEELVGAGLSSGRLRFTDDVAEAVEGADAVFLCVGTPSRRDGHPDMAAAEAAARAVGAHMRPGQVLVTKSTVPIGTGRWLSTTIEDTSGAPGHDVAVVSNPEFLREGNAVTDFLHPDRVVIGSEDEEALDVVARLYAPILEQRYPGHNGHRPPLVRTSLATAETIKYACNAFLATKISFINELANICELVGADVTEVAAGMGLDQRIGRHFLDAGLGWGGSCFGKDVLALTATAEDFGYEPQLLRAAVDVNRRQRLLAVEKLQRRLSGLRGRRIGILGLAFKPGTDDLRDAPALDIIDRLILAGSSVVAHDPVVHSLPDHPAVRLVGDPLDVADRADAVVVVTDWPDYVGLDLAAMRQRMRGDLLVDGRNLYGPETAIASGLRYESVGRDTSQTGITVCL